MHIEALYHYPIKSLRGISIPSATLTPQGLPHDRTFMLLRDHGEGAKHWKSGTRYENMHVSGFPQLCLFTTEIVEAVPDPIVDPSTSPSPDASSHDASNAPMETQPCIRITHLSASLTIPLLPFPTALSLPRIFIRMHQSPTLAYAMPAPYSAWFSKILGFDVCLAYLGHGAQAQPRPVLGNIAPNAATVNAGRQAELDARREKERAQEAWRKSWAGSFVTALTPSFLAGSTPQATETESEHDTPTAPAPTTATDTADATNLAESRGFKHDYGITFADCAAYLVCSSASLANVRERLEVIEGERLDMMRFRPNVVVGGVSGAWEEDYWGELEFSPAGDSAAEGNGGGNGEGRKATLTLTANCVRCTSLNVNYATGTQDGKVLKSLMKDRRVDRGLKYEPVFGRYGFLPGGGGDVGGREGGKEWKEVRVGDKVEVTKTNSEHGRMRWPGMQGNPKEEWFSV